MLEKYLALKIMGRNIDSLVIIRRSCLANKAILNHLRSLKHIPPSFFKSHITPDNSINIFLSSFLCPQQNLAIIFFNSIHKLFRSLKQLVIHVEINIITTLVRISHPPWVSNFIFHPCTLCQILCFDKEKAFDLDLPMIGVCQDILHIAETLKPPNKPWEHFEYQTLHSY